MGDFRHHVMMVNYYQRLDQILERKIFKAKYIGNCIGMSELERKLRLKKLEVEDNITFHQEMFVKNFVCDGKDYIEQPSTKDVYNYVALFQEPRKVKATITSDL